MIFAYIFIVLMIGAVIFQIALALGAPYGEFTLGGKYPGKLPLNLRITAILQAIILIIFMIIAISKSGIAFDFLYEISKIGIWVVFAFFIIGTILNLLSPSKKERIVMGTINIAALICAFMVAVGF